MWLRPVGYTGLGRALPDPASAVRFTAKLPAGVPYDAIVLQADGEGLYYGVERFISTTGSLVLLQTQQLSAAEIVRRIRLL